MKAMFEKIQSYLVQQEKEIIKKRIKELEELAYKNISEAYKINQDLTMKFMKEKRIGGLSIIGKVITNIWIDYIYTVSEVTFEEGPQH